MRRLATISAFGLVAMASSVASAQDASVTGACAKPDSLAFRGYSRVSESALRGDVAILEGAQLNYRTLQRAIKNLYATTQFEDVQVFCQVVNNRVTLIFDLKERPLLGEVDVRGPDRVAIGTIRDQVDILIGRPIDPAQVARVLARIDSVYAAKGFYLAQARAETTHVTAGTKITFVVNEGNRLAVSGVRVDGNQRIADREIVESMQTKPEGFFWWQKGEFDDNKYASDLTEKIPQTYAKHGFIDVQVVRDTLVIDRDRGKALVDVQVSEGPQYVVGDFEVNGARRFSSDEIRRYYPFDDRGRTLRETVTGLASLVKRSGTKDPENVFDAMKWEAATQQVQEAYMNEGYIRAQVRPVVERVKVGRDSVPTVNLRWEIVEDVPAIVNRVDIVGNDITTENCIRDVLLMFPGDVFKRDLLGRTYQALSGMQFFETPLPEPGIQQTEKGDIDITFKVKEKKTGNVNFGASVGQGTGVGGFIGFDQPNLFGMCKRGSLQWQFGRYINDFNVSYTDPRIRESRVTGTVTAYHTRSRFIVGNLGRTTRSGGQLRFGFPMPRSRWTRLFVDYGAERVSYGEEGLTSTISCGSGENCFRSSVGLGLERDTRLDPPFPSTGAQQSIQASFNGGPLGGTAAYQRYTGQLRGYSTLAQLGGGTPGSNPLRVVAGLSMKAGALFGNPGPFFIYQQFALGGVQYGEQLRGYEEFSITPSGYLFGKTGTDNAAPESFGSAFFTTSAELGLKVSPQLYLSTFFDAGNVWAKPRDFNPTRLFRGAGFGAALVTPLGPLGLDLGYGFDRTDAAGRRAPAWQMHFKFGQFF